MLQKNDAHPVNVVIDVAELKLLVVEASSERYQLTHRSLNAPNPSVPSFGLGSNNQIQTRYPSSMLLLIHMLLNSIGVEQERPFNASIFSFVSMA